MRVEGRRAPLPAPGRSAGRARPEPRRARCAGASYASSVRYGSTLDRVGTAIGSWPLCSTCARGRRSGEPEACTQCRTPGCFGHTANAAPARFRTTGCTLDPTVRCSPRRTTMFRLRHPAGVKRGDPSGPCQNALSGADPMAKLFNLTSVSPSGGDVTVAASSSACWSPAAGSLDWRPCLRCATWRGRPASASLLTEAVGAEHGGGRSHPAHQERKRRRPPVTGSPADLGAAHPVPRRRSTATVALTSTAACCRRWSCVAGRPTR